MAKGVNLNWIFQVILFLVIVSAVSSCKLKSKIPTSEFITPNNYKEINGVFLLPKVNADSLDTIYYGMGYTRSHFRVNDFVKGKDVKLLNDKDVEKISIFFDGKNKITFNFFDKDKNKEYKFTYECKRKDNFLEIYFKKTRIWALPLFMNYQYDRLRLGINKDSNLIFHKWNTSLTTLTIMPFDSFGGIDYRQELIRVGGR